MCVCVCCYVVGVVAFCDFRLGELEVLVESSAEFATAQPPRVSHRRVNV
jgi:hypothetical protein